ncbi:hypothetical protein GCM10010308_55750 [Streptomyces vinaceusdrappus]|nr:hypothetical protein GCM10010308_55750 [Streptomyces vinaceusdrappus]
MNACEHRSGASAPAVTLITSFFAMAASYGPPLRPTGGRTSPSGPLPGRVSWAPALCPQRTHRTPLTEEHPVEIFFEALLVLVCVGVLAFAGLTVKKLYQGQR